MSATHTFMVNPATEGEWRCPNALVDLYEKRGWKKADDPDEADVPPMPAPAAQVEEEPSGWDPTGRSVKEVNAYLDPIRDTHPGEVARVLLLERQGQNRPSIVGQPDAESKE